MGLQVFDFEKAGVVPKIAPQTAPKESGLLLITALPLV